MRLIQILATFLAALLALSGFARADAAMLAGVDALREWNLIVFNDARFNGDVEGRVFVGGNVSGNPAALNQFGTDGLTANGNTGITVGGNYAATGGSVDHGSGIRVGGDVTGRIDRNGGGIFEVGGSAAQQNGSAVQASLGINFTQTILDQRDTLISSLRDLSTNLSALTANASAVVTEQGNLTTIAASDASLNIVNMSLADLQDSRRLKITAPSGSTTVINVSGSGAFAKNWDGSTMAMDVAGATVLWNFYDATSLAFQSTIFGSVLAPLAAVTNNTAIEGSLYANSFNQGGEVHLAGFQGDLSSVGSVSAMPEPGTWAMLIVGFGLVGFMLRRRGSALVSRAA